MNEAVPKHGSQACMSVCHVSACSMCVAGGDEFSCCVDGLDTICFPCFKPLVRSCYALGSGLPSQVPSSHGAVLNNGQASLSLFWAPACNDHL